MNMQSVILMGRRVPITSFQKFSTTEIRHGLVPVWPSSTHPNNGSIPTAKGLPFIGTFFDILKSGMHPHFHEYIHKRHQELGFIFREHLGPVETIFLSDPEMQLQVYSCEGQYPLHTMPASWELYNQIHNCPKGLFFMEGEEWFTYRQILNSVLLDVSDEYIENVMAKPSRDIAKKFINDWKNKTEITNLSSLSYRWSVECVIAGLIGTGKKNEFALLEDDISEMGELVHEVFEQTAHLQFLPIEWSRTLKFSPWQKFEKSFTQALTLAKSIARKIPQLAQDHDGIISKLSKENVSVEFIDRVVTDLILGAGDMTSTSIQWMLYRLCRHQDVQENLRDILLNLDSSKKDYANPELKAFVRETFRLHPVAPFVTRYLNHTLDYYQYSIPKGSLVNLSIYSGCRNPRYFSDPDLFKIERWLGKSKKRGHFDLRDITPFAMGARSCIGSKFAQVMIKVFLSELIKNLKIELIDNRDIDMVLKLITVPLTPVNLKITKLDHSK